MAGLLLGSCLPMRAQVPTTQIVLAQTSSVSVIPFAVPRARLPLIVLPIPLFHMPLPCPGFFLAPAYKLEPTLESRLPIEEARGRFLTESSFLVAHLWRGLHLDIFDRTLHSQCLQLGSPSMGGGFQDFRPLSHDQVGITSSVEFDGISLRYSFGRDAETKKTAQMLRAWLGL